MDIKCGDVFLIKYESGIRPVVVYETRETLAEVFLLTTSSKHNLIQCVVNEKEHYILPTRYYVKTDTLTKFIGSIEPEKVVSTRNSLI